MSKCKRSVRVAGKIENKEMNKKGDEAIRFFNFPSYWLTGLSLLKLPSYSHIFYFHTIVICVQEIGRREREMGGENCGIFIYFEEYPFEYYHVQCEIV